MVRKLRGLLMAVACAVMMAVPVLAYTEVDISKYPGVTVQDGNTYLGTFPIANQSAEIKGYWEQAMSYLSGGASDYTVVVSLDTMSLRNIYIDFFAASANVTQSNGEILISKFAASLQLSSSGDTFSVRFYKYAASASAHYGSSRMFVTTAEFNLPDIAYIASYPGSLHIVDDLNNPMPEPKPDPTPEPEVPFEPAGPPSYEGDASGLPYDVGVFDALVWYLRDAIGNVSKVLILIAFLLAILASLIAMFWHYVFHRGDGGPL